MDGWRDGERDRRKATILDLILYSAWAYLFTLTGYYKIWQNKILRKGKACIFVCYVQTKFVQEIWSRTSSFTLDPKVNRVPSTEYFILSRLAQKAPEIKKETVLELLRKFHLKLMVDVEFSWWMLFSIIFIDWSWWRWYNTVVIVWGAGHWTQSLLCARQVPLSYTSSLCRLSLVSCHAMTTFR